jgi:hypothetical protein
MKIISGLLLLAAIFGGFMFFAPEYQRDKVVAVFTAATDERKCFNFHKKHFKDPSTAYLVDSYIRTKEKEQEYLSNIDPMIDKYGAVLTVSVQAKNGYGAYAPVYVECPLVDGKFDEFSALIARLDSIID